MVGRPAQRLRGRRTPRGLAAGELGRRAGGLGRTGGGGGCSGPRPAATIPPAALAAESRGRRCAGSPAGTPGVSPLGTAPAGGLGRGGTAAAAATLAPRHVPGRGSPARRQTLASRLHPFPSFPRSGPRGSTFLLSSLLPFSPFPGPRPAATRSADGEAGRAELRPSRGPARNARPRASRWKSLPAHLEAGAGV